MKNKYCVQCHREMINSYGNEEWSAPFCAAPQCPNFHLLQVGIEPQAIETLKRQAIADSFTSTHPIKKQGV